MKSVVVIGSGFAGLSAACFAAQAGYAVTVLDKNGQPGGRAQVFKAKGFTFDAGPSWYWMPDVFERFFAQFGYQVSDFYKLLRLDPSYQVIWEDGAVPIPAGRAALRLFFESYEPGSGPRFDSFLEEARFKYEKSMSKLVYKPALSPLEFVRLDVLSALLRLDLLQSVSKHLRKFFKHPKLLQLAEFPVLFLGALAQNTPALYTLMNWADMEGGTWYPMGGMAEIPKAMRKIAEALGVNFYLGEGATAIDIAGGKVSGVQTSKTHHKADAVIAACDYHHAESLLPEEYRNYSDGYWASRALAPFLPALLCRG